MRNLTMLGKLFFSYYDNRKRGFGKNKYEVYEVIDHTNHTKGQRITQVEERVFLV
jgi:hypothetical protein